MHNKKGTYNGVKEVTMKLFSILLTVALIILYFSMSTYFRVLSDQGTDTIKAELVTNLIVNCASNSENYIVESKFTSENIATCYPVSENERNLYPFQANIEWTQQGITQMREVKSPNAFDVYSEKITLPVLIQTETKTSLGMLTIEYEVL